MPRVTADEMSVHFVGLYDASDSKETISRTIDTVLPLARLSRPTLRSSSTRSWSRSATGGSPIAGYKRQRQ